MYVGGEDVHNSIHERIIAAKNNSIVRNQLIEEYTPFIKKTASKLLNRYIDVQNNEEFSIALMAFNEAIDTYDIEKHKNLFQFIELVIKRRLIDYLRSQKKFNPEVTFSYIEQTTHESYLENLHSIEFEQCLPQSSLQEEIQLYSKLLEEFGLHFQLLAKISPKHRSSRDMMKKIASYIAQQPVMVQYLNSKKKLPMKQLSKEVEVSRITLERHRKYLIALIILHTSNLTLLKEYIK